MTAGLGAVLPTVKWRGRIQAKTDYSAAQHIFTVHLAHRTAALLISYQYWTHRQHIGIKNRAGKPKTLLQGKNNLKQLPLWWLQSTFLNLDLWIRFLSDCGKPRSRHRTSHQIFWCGPDVNITGKTSAGQAIHRAFCRELRIWEHKYANLLI